MYLSRVKKVLWSFNLIRGSFFLRFGKSWTWLNLCLFTCVKKVLRNFNLIRGSFFLRFGKTSTWLKFCIFARVKKVLRNFNLICGSFFLFFRKYFFVLDLLIIILSKMKFFGLENRIFQLLVCYKQEVHF